MRLMNLIDILQEEHEDCPEPPECAASEWTETEVRHRRFILHLTPLRSATSRPRSPTPKDACIRSQPHAAPGSRSVPSRE
jgi:hypothetical protein